MENLILVEWVSSTRVLWLAMNITGLCLRNKLFCEV